MPKKLLIILGCFVAIIVISLLLIKEIDSYKGLQKVWVAKMPIAKGTKITSDMIELKDIALNRADSTHSGQRVAYYKDVFKQADKKKVVGKYALYDFIPGELMLDEKLVTKLNTGGQYMSEIPTGYYAVPITAGDEGKSGLIKVNDYIDLIVSTKDQGTVDEPALRHLRVYDLRSDKGLSVSDSTKDEKGQIIPIKFIIVALNDYQLKKYVYYTAQKADMLVAIRRRADEDYEIYDNPNQDYPGYSVQEGQIVDSQTEQNIIATNRDRLDAERNGISYNPDNSANTTGVPANTTNTTNAASAPSTTNTTGSDNTKPAKK